MTRTSTVSTINTDRAVSTVSAAPAATVPRSRHAWLAGLVVAMLLAAGGAWLAADGASAVAAASGEDAAPLRYAVLQRQIERNPADVRARVLKARLDLQAGRHELAAAGLRRALDQSPKVARDPDVWVELAEATALQQGGRLAGEPVTLIEHALALRPDHPQALDLAGSAAWEQRDFRAAAAHWRRLLGQLADDDPRRVELTAALADAERRARLALPPAR